ncbi:MAG TPA: acetolactate synthase small subunit, partial [Tepidisphaeraceae bacterium]
MISALVVNEPGVLANVAGMFAARGFNIDSLVVGRTEDANLSRMTIVVDADENTLEQVRKQLAKLVPVTQVKDFKDSAYIERDLALVTVVASPEHRFEVIEVVNLFRGKVVDVAKESMMVELSGTEQKIEAFIQLMKPYGIR